MTAIDIWGFLHQFSIRWPDYHFHLLMTKHWQKTFVCPYRCRWTWLSPGWTCVLRRNFSTRSVSGPHPDLLKKIFTNIFFLMWNWVLFFIHSFVLWIRVTNTIQFLRFMIPKYSWKHQMAGNALGIWICGCSLFY